MRLPDSLAPLRDRRFAWFFTGRCVSTAGSVMAPVALTFAVLDMGVSYSGLGQILAARSMALVLFLLVGGVIADRFSRAVVLQVSHVCSALVQGVVAVLVLTGQATIGQLIVLQVAHGAVNAFTMPAIQGLVPQVVPRSHMQQANALLSFSRSGLAVLGPTVAAVLVVTVGAGWALAFDALSWLLAGLCMIPVRLPARESVRGSRGSLWHELSSGWSMFVSHTWLWVVVLAFGLLNAIYAGVWLTLGPGVAKAAPGVGETGWGMTLSAQAVGLLVLTVVMLRLTFRRPLLAGMLAMLALVLPLLALGLRPELVPLVVCAFFAGAGVEVFGISWQTAMHEHVPEDHMSRVSAYDSLGSFVAIPFGQLIFGPLAARFGAQPVILAGAAAFVVIVLATVAVPSVRNLARGPVGDAAPVGGPGPP